MKPVILLCAALAALPVTALADTSRASVDVDVHASTLGLGLGLARGFTDSVSGRLSFNKYTYSYQTSSDNINFDSELKLGSVAALADWHVFNGYAHLTAGLIYNNNEFDMTATPVGTSYTINGNTYTTSTVGSLKANVTFNKIAPYLGFGWSGQARKTGFSFKSDIGVMFQGSPKSTLTATGAASNSALAADVAAAQVQLDSDLEKYKYYLVISVGLGYAF